MRRNILQGMPRRIYKHLIRRRADPIQPGTNSDVFVGTLLVGSDPLFNTRNEQIVGLRLAPNHTRADVADASVKSLDANLL